MTVGVVSSRFDFFYDNLGHRFVYPILCDTAMRKIWPFARTLRGGKETEDEADI